MSFVGRLLPGRGPGGHVNEIEERQGGVVGRGITETAVNNKSLHLELEYRQPSMLGEDNANNEEPATDTRLTLQYDHRQA